MENTMTEPIPNFDRTIALARLAMLIECEGCIGIGMTPPTKTRTRPALQPYVFITNTSKAIIDEATNTLLTEGLGFGIRPLRYNSGFGTKLRYDIYVRGFDKLDALLNAILPFINSKKRQAELVLEFVGSRRASHPKSPYSDREWEITTEVRLLNGTQPQRKALEKAKAYLELPSADIRSRTSEYFKKYVEMCETLQGEF